MLSSKFFVQMQSSLLAYSAILYGPNTRQPNLKRDSIVDC